MHNDRLLGPAGRLPRPVARPFVLKGARHARLDGNVQNVRLILLCESLQADGLAQLVNFLDSGLHRLWDGVEPGRRLDHGAVFVLAQGVVDESVVRLAVLDLPQGFVVDHRESILIQ